MTYNYPRWGFTLIELLVVVLIIGILAAIAVPQYELAVAKAHVARLMPLLKTLHDAQEAYYLTNGHHALTFEELDVDIPTPNSITATHPAANGTSVYGDQAIYDDFNILLLSHSGKIVYATLTKPVRADFGMYLTGTSDTACRATGKVAIAGLNNTRANALIRSMGGTEYTRNTGYIYYCLP